MNNIVKEIRFVYNNKSIIVTKEDVKWFNNLNEEYIAYNAGAKHGIDYAYFCDVRTIYEFCNKMGANKDKMHCIADNARLLAIAFDVDVFVWVK